MPGPPWFLGPFSSRPRPHRVDGPKGQYLQPSPPSTVGLLLEPHNGTVVPCDPIGIAPFEQFEYLLPCTALLTHGTGRIPRHSHSSLCSCVPLLCALCVLPSVTSVLKSLFLSFSALLCALCVSALSFPFSSRLSFSIFSSSLPRTSTPQLTRTPGSLTT